MPDLGEGSKFPSVKLGHVSKGDLIRCHHWVQLTSPPSPSGGGPLTIILIIFHPNEKARREEGRQELVTGFQALQVYAAESNIKAPMP